MIRILRETNFPGKAWLKRRLRSFQARALARRPSKKYSADAVQRLSKQRKSHYWYRGEHCNFNPTLWDMNAYDAVQRHIVNGWLPETPFITRSTRIAAFGSCFAANIGKYLDERFGHFTVAESDAYVVSMRENLVNTYALRQQFEWAFEGAKPTTPLWHGYRAEQFSYDEDKRRATLEIFSKTDVFILTLGLSEVWYDEPTGEVFWRAVPQDMYDPARHKFRVATTEENRRNIRAIYDLVRKYRPDAKLIFTLSPIPLIATFRPQSYISANTVSKAVLRAAVDEVYREVAREGHFFYWPSYEIVTEAFGARPDGGRFNADRRHVDLSVLQFVMRLFEDYYCEGTKPARSVLDTYVAARCATGDLHPEIYAAVAGGDGRLIRTLVDERLADNDRQTAELIVRFAIEKHPEDGYDELLPLVTPPPESAALLEAAAE